MTRLFLTLLLFVVIFGSTACGGGVNAYDRANLICGGKGNLPTRIIQHNGEFANEDWLEVRCSDGSIRAIPNA